MCKSIFLVYLIEANKVNKPVKFLQLHFTAIRKFKMSLYLSNTKSQKETAVVPDRNLT